MKNKFTTWRATIALMLIFAATTVAACGGDGSNAEEPDTSGDSTTEVDEGVADSDSANTETTDLSDGAETMGACVPSADVILAGSYIVGVETSLNRDAPFIFRLNVEEDSGQYDLELQALVKDDCPQGVGCGDSTPRSAADRAFGVAPVFSDTNGILNLSFARGLEIPASANSATGIPLSADFNFEFSLCNPDRLCGSVALDVNSPIRAELSGTAEAFATDDFSLEAVPVVSGNCTP